MMPLFWGQIKTLIYPTLAIIYCHKMKKSNRLRKKNAEKLAGIKYFTYLYSVNITQ